MEQRRRLEGVAGYLSDPAAGEFDRLVYERVRLGIMSALAVNPKMTFSELKELLQASDGNQAIELASSKEPDLIILDAMLPKRSGFLVLEKLKSSPAAAKPPVIMITGNPGTRHKAWAQSLGVDEYLSKPFRMERLIEMAEKLLGS